MSESGSRERIRVAALARLKVSYASKYPELQARRGTPAIALGL